MASERHAARALALTAVGLGVAAAAAAACYAWRPDQPLWLAIPGALAAGAFLLGVRRLVKPARTGHEER